MFVCCKMCLLRLPCEQRVLSFMAFSINKVVHVACLLVVGLVTLRESIDKPTTQQTGHVNGVVHATSHARGKPLLAGYTKMGMHEYLSISYWHTSMSGQHVYREFIF